MNPRPFLVLFILCMLKLPDLVGSLPIAGGCWSPFTFALQRKAFIRDALTNEKCVVIQPTTLFIETGKKRAFCPSNVLDVAANRKILGLSPSDELVVKDHEEWNTFGIVQNVKCNTVNVSNGKCSRQARSITATNSTTLIRQVRSSDSESDFEVSIPSGYDSDATIIIDCPSTDQRGEKRPREDDTDTEDEEDIEPSTKRPKLAKPQGIVPFVQVDRSVLTDMSDYDQIRAIANRKATSILPLIRKYKQSKKYAIKDCREEKSDAPTTHFTYVLLIRQADRSLEPIYLGEGTSSRPFHHIYYALLADYIAAKFHHAIRSDSDKLDKIRTAISENRDIFVAKFNLKSTKCEGEIFEASLQRNEFFSVKRLTNDKLEMKDLDKKILTVQEIESINAHSLRSLLENSIVYKINAQEFSTFNEENFDQFIEQYKISKKTVSKYTAKSIAKLSSADRYQNVELDPADKFNKFYLLELEEESGFKLDSRYALRFLNHFKSSDRSDRTDLEIVTYFRKKHSLHTPAADMALANRPDEATLNAMTNFFTSLIDEQKPLSLVYLAINIFKSMINARTLRQNNRGIGLAINKVLKKRTGQIAFDDGEGDGIYQSDESRPKIGAKVLKMLDGASNPTKVIPEYQAESGMTNDQLAEYERELLAAYNPDEPDLNNGGRIQSKEWEVDPASYYILHSWNLAKIFETPTKLRPNKNAQWTSAGGNQVGGAPKAFGDFINEQLENGDLAGLSDKAKASIAKGETFLPRRTGKTQSGKDKMNYMKIDAFLNAKDYGPLTSAKVDRNTDPNKKRDMQPVGLGDYRQLEGKIDFYLQRLSNEFPDDVDILTRFVGDSIERTQ